MLHNPGLSAHHIGCSCIAWMPLCLMRNATSCKRGSASLEFPPGPDQNTSAEVAARGQTMESRFSGPDCSVHSSCSPPRTRCACDSEMFAWGSKV